MSSIEKNEKIKYIFLPPAFIAKGYIGGKGAPSCNYEEYLAELINESSFFRKRVNGKQIKLVEKQDQGQPDIFENCFSLDFKLISGESAIVAQKLTAQSITQISDGAVAYGIASGKKKGYEAVHIHLALRNYSCDELIELSQHFRKDNIIQHDIVHLLNSLRVDKNLMLYLPYAFTVEDESNENARKMVTEVLEDCFGSALEYRTQKIPTKETFFCCIHNQQMLFYECKNKSIALVDSVNTWCSNTFRKIARYYDLRKRTIEVIIGKEHLWDKP